MKKYIFFYLTLILFFLIFFLFLYNFNLREFRVAHAGGELNGLKYVNSIASMKLNSKYTKYIELDLQLTKDNRLVCINDPLINNKYFNKLLKEFPEKDFCYDETLIKFLKENQEIIIITDFKTDNIQGLNFIKKNFEQFSKRFIPQIYNEHEYLPVKKLGYEKIIFTLYRVSSYSNEKIAKIIENFDLFGLTMDPARLKSRIIKKIHKKDFLIYVYTVNSYLRFLQYKIFFGADEIYTDNLF